MGSTNPHLQHRKSCVHLRELTHPSPAHSLTHNPLTRSLTLAHSLTTPNQQNLHIRQTNHRHSLAIARMLINCEAMRMLDQLETETNIFAKTQSMNNQSPCGPISDHIAGRIRCRRCARPRTTRTRTGARTETHMVRTGSGSRGENTPTRRRQKLHLCLDHSINTRRCCCTHGNPTGGATTRAMCPTTTEQELDRVWERERGGGDGMESLASDKSVGAAHASTLPATWLISQSNSHQNILT